MCNTEKETWHIFLSHTHTRDTEIQRYKHQTMHLAVGYNISLLQCCCCFPNQIDQPATKKKKIFFFAKKVSSKTFEKRVNTKRERLRYRWGWFFFMYVSRLYCFLYVCICVQLFFPGIYRTNEKELLNGYI